MKIVIPGGSGQVGTVLARAFQKDGHDVVVLRPSFWLRPVAYRELGRRDAWSVAERSRRRRR